MNLNMLFGFMQVLNINRKYATKNEYFPKHIAFTTIYLLQKHKLNHRNHTKKEINMRIFLQANEDGMNMYAKIRYKNMHRFL
jgi:hypothetical protein